MDTLPSSTTSIPNEQTRQMAMLLHLSQFAGYIAFGLGFIVPIVIWQMKKDEMPALDAHGKVVVNWMLSAILYGFICGVLCFVLVGFLLFAPLGLMCVAFPIIGAIKANNGEVWKYPLTIEFIK